MERPREPGAPSNSRDPRAFFGSKVEAYRRSRSHGNRADLDRMLELLHPTRGARALDVATGGGHTALALRDGGCSVVASDITLPMLAALRNDGVAGVAADAGALPFGARSFDIVASRIAPHHFSDLSAFVGEAARILRSGGLFYIFDLTSPHDPHAARVIDQIERLRDPSHVCSWGRGAWEAALRAGGFTVDHLVEQAAPMDLEPWIARAEVDARREGQLRDLLSANPAARTGGYGIDAEGRFQVLRIEILAHVA
ncbi:MAG: class I SAM-dependent methyltransferase [Thermoplasmatota archaeon]